MGNRQGINTLINQLLEEGNNRTAGTNNVAIPNDCKTGWVLTRNVVGRHEEFV